MTTRRQFLGALGIPAVMPSAARLRTWAVAEEALAGLETRREAPERLAEDEDLWAAIGAAFAVDRSILNLNNGGVSPSPAFVQDALRRHVEYSNEAPPYTMWRVLQPQLEAVRERLARFMGVDAEEVAITRNASEGLQTCQFGFDLARGDEVLCTDQDYPRMLTTFRQREAREGIVLRTFAIPTPCDDPAEIVARYRANLTDRTRLILCCHVINITGQILPVREIVALGRERGIPVIVDGAHAFANVAFNFAELGCDYYATSLHKWLFAPIGTGMLFVRRHCIAGLWPLMAATAEQADDIRKFEEIGTHPIANPLAIAEALTFHERLGSARKQARLLKLRDRWAERLAEHGRIRLHTSLAPGRACGIANFAIEGIDPVDLADYLFDEHRIVTAPIRHVDCPGIRVSPSVYTSARDIDRFCDVVLRVAERGLPG